MSRKASVKKNKEKYPTNRPHNTQNRQSSAKGCTNLAVDNSWDKPGLGKLKSGKRNDEGRSNIKSPRLHQCKTEVE